jgi:tRNA threonylcarbamoyladenosine biosynthesis protein TsaB
MRILGFETSSAVCSVGLFDSVLGQTDRSLVESHIHSEKLLALLHDVCENANVQLKDLDGLAVSIGPGSFTGLRIGLSTAKGLCVALRKPLYAVSTFKAIASAAFHGNARAETATICVDARQGDFYVAQYRRSGEEIVPVRDVAVVSTTDLTAVIRSSPYVISDRVSQIREIAAPETRIAELNSYCRGSEVSMLGSRDHSAGHRSDVASLEPVYLKDFVVRTGPATAPLQPQL